MEDAGILRTRGSQVSAQDVGERRAVGRTPLPGSPVDYYVDVVRSRWFYLAGGAASGALLAALVLALVPASVTATTSVQLAVVATDPASVNDSPSSRIDSATEQEVGRSFVVASRAASNLGSELSPAEVAEATTIIVAADSAIARVQFTHPDPKIAVAGADAVAEGYLALRLDQVRAQAEQQREVIDIRVAELEEALAAVEPGAGSSARTQVLSEELSALALQRAGLTGLPPQGGRVITPASSEDVVASRPWGIGVTTGLLVGVLLGVAAAFVRRVGPRQISGLAELADRSGRPVWSPSDAPQTADRWLVASRLMVARMPRGCQKLVVGSLAGAVDTADLAIAVGDALAVRGEVACTVATVDVWTSEGLASTIDALYGSAAVVLVVDPATTTITTLRRVVETLTEMGVPFIGSFWCTPRASNPHRAA